jgi:hypothetical protein
VGRAKRFASPRVHLLGKMGFEALDLFDVKGLKIAKFGVGLEAVQRLSDTVN